MDRAWRWKFIGLLLLIAASVGQLLPTLRPNEGQLPSWFKNIFNKKITLGLDLQGGFQVSYSVDYDVVVDEKASALRADIEDKLKTDLQLKSIKARSFPGGQISVQLSPEDLKKLPADWMKGFEGLAKRTCPANTAEGTICLRVSGAFEDKIRSKALAQAVRVIRQRADEFGVAEPTIIERGDRIAVELPGAKPADIERIKSIIDRTARLEFKIVEEGAEASEYMAGLAAAARDDKELKIDDKHRRIRDYTFAGRGDGGYEITLIAQDEEKSISAKEAFERRCQLKKNERAWDQAAPGDDKRVVKCVLSGQRLLSEWLDKQYVKLPLPTTKDNHTLQIAMEEVQRRTAEMEDDDEEDPLPPKYWRTHLVRASAELTGDAVSSADVVADPVTGFPEVSVNFTRSGGNRFEALTGRNVGRRMAIILDEKVNSAPNIETKIGGGRARITMGGSDPQEVQREAEDLVNVLRTGSLPAPLREEYASRIGPSLGSDAIKGAQLAIAVGAALVFLFMLVYYRASGFIADLSVVLNILFMLAILVGLQATLTLPGIAGLSLTIGMAVDSNIIIYERIREELRAGKSARGAVDAGFGRAFWTVFDAHLTNAIAGFVLLSYGTGPIRGFAVTLLAGIAVNLFTSVWCTRVMFDFMVGRKTAGNEISI